MTEFLRALAQSRKPLSPQEEQFHRAGEGAGLLAMAAVWAYALQTRPAVRIEIADMLHESPWLQAYVWIPVAFWAFAVIAGLLMFLTGVNRSRGRRDAMVAAKALAWIAGAAALIQCRAFVDGSALANVFLLGVYVWTLASGTTRFLLAVRGIRAERLPDPEEMEDLPTSGPAPLDRADEILKDNQNRQPPRFRD